MKTYVINSLRLQIDSNQVDRVSNQIRTNKADFLSLACGPEHCLPRGVEWSSLAHSLYVTYTCLIDYNLRRVADDLWAASRRLFEDHPKDLYPHDIVKKGPKFLTEVFGKHFQGIYRAPSSPEKMAYRMFQTAQYLSSVAEGDPRKLLSVYLQSKQDRDAVRFLEWLKNQRYQGLPNGDKVIKLWFRTMCESEQIELGHGMWRFTRQELAKVPLPVDKNIISAGIALGVVRIAKGSFRGSFSDVKQPFHDAWMTVAQESQMLPLELDEPLWKIGRSCRRKRCMSDCFFSNVCPGITDFMFLGEKIAPGPEWDILVWPTFNHS